MNPIVKYDIDSDGLKYRVMEGKFIHTPNVMMEFFNSMKDITSIPYGFRRERQNYVLSPDGSELSYKITDVQIV